MGASKRNMVMVFDRYVSPRDDVAYIEFDNRIEVKIALQPKAPFMREIFMRARQQGGTNFWDAMISALAQLDAAGRRKKKYIIALTDGDNGRSTNTLDAVCEALRAHPEVTPFIIGAGDGLSERSVREMRRMVGQEPLVPQVGGMYVGARDATELEAAFEQVAAAMQEATMES